MTSHIWTVTPIKKWENVWITFFNNYIGVEPNYGIDTVISCKRSHISLTQFFSPLSGCLYGGFSDPPEPRWHRFCHISMPEHSFTRQMASFLMTPLSSRREWCRQDFLLLYFFEHAPHQSPRSSFSLATESDEWINTLMNDHNQMTQSYTNINISPRMQII